MDYLELKARELKNIKYNCFNNLTKFLTTNHLFYQSGDRGRDAIGAEKGEKGVKGEPGPRNIIPGPKGERGYVGLPGLPGEKGG